MNRIQRLWVGVLVAMVGVAGGLVSTPAASAAPAASYGPLNSGMTSQEGLRDAQRFALLLGNTASGNENYRAMTYVIRSLLAKLPVRCVEAKYVNWEWENPGIRPPGFSLNAGVRFAFPAGYTFERLQADVYRILRAERGMTVTHDRQDKRVSGSVMPTPVTVVGIMVGSEGGINRFPETSAASGRFVPGMALSSGRVRDAHTAPLGRPEITGVYRTKSILDPRCLR